MSRIYIDKEDLDERIRKLIVNVLMIPDPVARIQRAKGIKDVVGIINQVLWDSNEPHAPLIAEDSIGEETDAQDA